MLGLKEIWFFLLFWTSLMLQLHSSSAKSMIKTDSLKTQRNVETNVTPINNSLINFVKNKDKQNSGLDIPVNNTHTKHNQESKLAFDDIENAFKHESFHPTIVPFPLIYDQMFGIKKHKNEEEKSKLFIHKFGNLRNLISQKQWIEIQAIINQKTPLRTKHFDITKILTEQTKFNKFQVRIFWNDFFDFHEMKKVLMLHNKILQSFGQKSINNYGIYDVDLSVATKVKLLNAQIKRYLPKKDYEIYLRIQSKVFELSKGEKEALLL